MKTKKVGMIIGYGVSLLILSPLLLYGSFAFVDGFGIDRLLPGALTTLLILLLPSLVFTLLGLVPLIALRRCNGRIKQVAIMLFVASFIFNVILLFLGFMVVGC